MTAGLPIGMLPDMGQIMAGSIMSGVGLIVADVVALGLGWVVMAFVLVDGMFGSVVAIGMMTLGVGDEVIGWVAVTSGETVGRGTAGDVVAWTAGKVGAAVEVIVGEPFKPPATLYDKVSYI